MTDTPRYEAIGFDVYEIGPPVKPGVPDECKPFIWTVDPALARRVAAALNGSEELLDALKRAQRLFEEALPKFDWGKSALDANAIRLLNEVPGEIRAAIASTTPETEGGGG